MKKLKYQDFSDEFAGGEHYGIFIDDTGSPGLQSLSPRLNPDRKSWVAVVIPPSQMPDVLLQLPEAIEELRRLTGATEFHFSEIYQGKREFKGIDLAVRLNLFKFMAFIFKTYMFPVFVQTFDPESLKLVRSRAPFPEKVGPFDLSKVEDASLLFLLIWLKKYLVGQDGTARVFVDEGYKKAGVAISTPVFDGVFTDSSVYFARSNSMTPIQLADFAAFALNREQLLLVKEELKDLDIQLLQIFEPIVKNFQNINTGNLRLVKVENTWELEQ